MSSKQTTESRGTTSLTAKGASKVVMALASVFVVAMFVLKSLNLLDFEADELIKIAIAAVALWSPTYVSMYLDKFKELLGKGTKTTQNEENVDLEAAEEAFKDEGALNE